MDGSKQCLETGVGAVAAPVARDWQTPLLLLLVGAVFGSAFLFMRVAAPELGPQTLAAVRRSAGRLLRRPSAGQAPRRLPLRRGRLLPLTAVVNGAIVRK